MANLLKGEVAIPQLPVPGFEKGGVFLFDVNALIALEGEIGDVAAFDPAMLAKPTMLATLFRIGLEEHHGQVDLRTAGKVVHHLGLSTAAEIFTTSFQASFPEAAQAGTADPRKAKAGGTGNVSSAIGANAGSIRKPSGGKRRG